MNTKVIHKNKRNAIESGADFRFQNCILPLLKAHDWKGKRREVTEAIPYLTNDIGINRFCLIMKRLGFEYKKIKNVTIGKLEDDFFPCLFLDGKEDPYVLSCKEGKEIEAFSGKIKKNIKLEYAGLRGTLYKFSSSEDLESIATSKSWLGNILTKHKPLIWGAIAISFILTLLTILMPVYVMSVYDRVIGAGSYDMLRQFWVGMAMTIIAVFFFSQMRSKILSYVGAQLDKEIGNAVFQKLIAIGVPSIKSASVESQIARIREFRVVRDFFTGPLFQLCFDAPFSLLFILAIYILAGPLAFVPIGMGVFFFISYFLSKKNIQSSSAIYSEGSKRMQEFLLESLEKMRTIRHSGASDIWEKRFGKYSSDTSLASRKTNYYAQINLSVADGIMTLSALTLMTYGVLLVLDGSISVGALVACMILVWKALMPIKQLYIAMPKLYSLKNSIFMINALMSMKTDEDNKNSWKNHSYDFEGSIFLDRVSFRYPAGDNVTLRNITFKANPGEFIIIVGRNGSGKSTILKLISDLHYPQGGNIYIDNVDIRQFNPILFRKSIGYAPQEPEVLYGTIAQNIQLADPSASMSKIVEASKVVGLLEDIKKLPNGFNTSFKDVCYENASRSLLNKINIARALVKDSNILLLDEPGHAFNESIDKEIIKNLLKFKGKKTIIMTTFKKSHLQHADKILVMEDGEFILEGTPEEVIPKIPEGYL